MRGATVTSTYSDAATLFQSTRPMRGATRLTPATAGIIKFQSTRPMRGATIFDAIGRAAYEFQSTRPMRGATRRSSSGRRAREFQSTRPMRGATGSAGAYGNIADISIHAPHAGRDSKSPGSGRDLPDFNPRAPCGARRRCCVWHSSTGNFNPRAPCGARRCGRNRRRWKMLFQSTRPMRGATV